MDTVNILYIDDSIDPFISQYLDEKYANSEVSLEYNQREFKTSESYDDLLSDDLVKSSDIIVIDSVLFEHSKSKNEKLTGEEFEVMLHKAYPYKKAMVVSQNDFEGNIHIIKKYSSLNNDGVSADSFFEQEWKPILDEFVEDIVYARKTLKEIERKKYIDAYFLEEIQNSIAGHSEYEGLSIKDIDKLVEIFEDIREKYDN